MRSSDFGATILTVPVGDVATRGELAPRRLEHDLPAEACGLRSDPLSCAARTDRAGTPRGPTRLPVELP